MRIVKKTVIAVATAGSLAVLGGGVANAEDDAKKPRGYDKKPVPAVEHNQLDQSQQCSYKALIPINLNLLAHSSTLGSVNCKQSGSIS